jgi:hypothetical protein
LAIGGRHEVIAQDCIQKARGKCLTLLVPILFEQDYVDAGCEGVLGPIHANVLQTKAFRKGSKIIGKKLSEEWGDCQEQETKTIVSRRGRRAEEQRAHSRRLFNPHSPFRIQNRRLKRRGAFDILFHHLSRPEGGNFRDKSGLKSQRMEKNQ